LVHSRTHDGKLGLDFLPDRGNLCGQEAAVPHLSPTTLTTDEHGLIARSTAGIVRDTRIWAVW